MPFFNINLSHKQNTRLFESEVRLWPLTAPRRLCLFTGTLALMAMMLTAGCSGNGRATHDPFVPARSEGKQKQTVKHQPPPTSVQSPLENTERNTRDRGNETLTPTDQKENRKDLDITAAIRKSVVNNKSLSLDAHNAKIITRDGIVTLRGPVKNSTEKSKLQSIARKVKGVKQVDNQLEAKSP